MQSAAASRSATPRSCSRATSPRSAIRTGAHELVAELAEYADGPGLQHAHRRPPPVPGARRPADPARGVRPARRARLAYVGDGNNVARSLALIGAIAGARRSSSPRPAGYELEPRRRRAARPRSARGRARGERRLHRRLGLDGRRGDGRTARRAALAPYRIDDALLDRAAPGAIALHCLPAHPGEEITAEVLYGERQRIWDQAENRRHAQKALLELLLRMTRPRPVRRRPRRAPDRPRGAAGPPLRIDRRQRPEPLPGAACDPREPMNAPTHDRVSVGRRARAADRLARLRRCRRRPAPRRLRRVRRRGASPATASARAVGKRKRAYAEARVARGGRRRAPTGSSRVAEHPGAPWQVLPYARSSRSRPSRSTTRCGGSASSTASTLEPIVPAVAGVALPQQARVLVRDRDRDGALICGFHAPGRWEEIVRDRPTACSPPSAATRAREQVARLVPRAGPRRRTTAAPTRASCATSSSARAGARGEIQVAPGHRRRASSTSESLVAGASRVDGLLWTAHDARRRDDRRAARPSCSPARAASTSEVGDLDLQDLGRGVLPDQHRDGRAALRAGRSSTPELKGFERVYDLYCGIGTIGLLAGPAGRPRCGASRWSPRRSPTRSPTRARNEIDNAHFFAGDVRLALRELVEQAGRPDVLVVDPPRAGLSQKVVRRIIEASPEADRLRLLQPDDARPERRAARRGRLRAEPGPPGRHVPADAAHRVRRAARTRLGRVYSPVSCCLSQSPSWLSDCWTVWPASLKKAVKRSV